MGAVFKLIINSRTLFIGLFAMGVSCGDLRVDPRRSQVVREPMEAKVFPLGIVEFRESTGHRPK